MSSFYFYFIFWVVLGRGLMRWGGGGGERGNANGREWICARITANENRAWSRFVVTGKGLLLNQTDTAAEVCKRISFPFLNIF